MYNDKINKQISRSELASNLESLNSDLSKYIFKV